MIQEILDKESEEREKLILKIAIPLLILSEAAHIYVCYIR